MSNLGSERRWSECEAVVHAIHIVEPVRSVHWRRSLEAFHAIHEAGSSKCQQEECTWPVLPRPNYARVCLPRSRQIDLINVPILNRHHLSPFLSVSACLGDR